MKSSTARAAKRFRSALAALALTAAAAWAGENGLQPPPAPTGNPPSPGCDLESPDPAVCIKENLGKVLFWDEQVSSTGTVACGTCHIPAVGGGDPRGGQEISHHPGPDGQFDPSRCDPHDPGDPGCDDIFGSPGVVLNHADGSYDWSPLFGMLLQVTRRRTISAINAGYDPDIFWDGRARSEFKDPVTGEVVPGMEEGAALESQAVGPPVNSVEMGHDTSDWTSLLERLATAVPLALSPEVPAALEVWMAGRSYPELFAEVFGTPELTAPRFAMAVAAFERTQFTNQTLFDDFLNTGNDDAWTPEEQAGFQVFNSENCNTCHQQPLLGFEGPAVEDHFRYTGVRPAEDDLGREEVTNDKNDRAQMRVPSLRNLDLRAPYMHNGRFATIEEVIEFYDRGGDFGCAPPCGTKDPVIKPLELLEQQKADLAAFLKRPLTDSRLAAGLPPFDRPTLYTESSRVPVIEGSGVPGSGGYIPEVVALEPPVMGNPSFTVGIWNALGGGQALLVIDNVDPGLAMPTCGDLEDPLVCAPVGLQGDVGIPGAGFGSHSIAIPADQPDLIEAEWFGRWYVDDPGAPSGTAVSKVFRFETYRGRQLGSIFSDGFESGNTSAWDATTN